MSNYQQYGYDFDQVPPPRLKCIMGLCVSNPLVSYTITRNQSKMDIEESIHHTIIKDIYVSFT